MTLSRKYKFLFLITPIVLFLDQLTKWLVVKEIPYSSRIPIIPGYFDLVHFRNRGAAFGMLSELPDHIRPFFFYGIAVVAVIVLFFYFRSLKGEEKLMPITLSLILGGIFGNILDRLRYGDVVDFLSFHFQEKIIRGVYLEWPAFNVADSAITVAMMLLIVSTLKTKGSHDRQKS
ncbi:MAG: signal peptidase II [Deltaproteobacteria bacterium RIFCSPLOWO2_02_FULL_44_10]|nr:MAG: signal peptidase II [Deltaproteobacteria bacterium RIFCSPHIGHO2_02_FULL_44_16]OGQ46742.1 MAG: signal peptidase II [Deltaproteobacteria bacterium RIFCSPLOWO2_02_FULL_44_10]